METNEQKIINFLSQGINKDSGYCDDCLSNKLQIKPRQQINQICRNLENDRKISRIKSTCYICKNFKISNFVKTDVDGVKTVQGFSMNKTKASAFETHNQSNKWSYENEWFEETNISRKIRDYLKETGHEIIRFNDDKRQKGHDIEVVKNGIKTIIEVKGYPSEFYVGTEKQGKRKPTYPNLQAKHWFSEALLSLLSAKCEAWDEVTIAMGLPRYPKYEELCSRIATLREKLGMKIYFVDCTGKIEEN
ncbi:MAG: hypothetical protein NTW30_04445 [Candidatus Aenigmarchaeota archaeon]|nr:hypothetical protein [Candidatus Aenigmarchaeota archaeon]